MTCLEKQPSSSCELKADPAHRSSQEKARSAVQLRTIRLVDGARAGVSLLALFLGLAGLVATSLAIRDYNVSRFGPLTGSLAWLSVWPDNSAFDIQPTVSLAVGFALVVLANAVALAADLRFIRARLAAAVHRPVALAAPLVGLVAALVSVISSYVANQSAAVDTLTSWSCRWRFLQNTGPAPPFASLCRTGHAGLNLAILLIPIEFFACVLVGHSVKLRRMPGHISTNHVEASV
ncbi:hypothetical protein SEPCBS119000_005186 [Sporothrix epigloea]|uniref:Integral membrane protein n=1 Tax=Sporothrix epigloea TaxID=1892477 RepID=A0ABP0DWE5_9PEZI